MKDQVFGVLQSIGRSFMLPVSILPIAGLLLGIGASFTNPTTIATYGLENILGSGTIANALLTIMSSAGNVIFGNLPLIFAVGVAIGMASRAPCPGRDHRKRLRYHEPSRRRIRRHHRRYRCCRAPQPLSYHFITECLFLFRRVPLCSYHFHRRLYVCRYCHVLHLATDPKWHLCSRQPGYRYRLYRHVDFRYHQEGSYSFWIASRILSPLLADRCRRLYDDRW